MRRTYFSPFYSSANRLWKVKWSADDLTVSGPGSRLWASSVCLTLQLMFSSRPQHPTGLFTTLLLTFFPLFVTKHDLLLYPFVFPSASLRVPWLLVFGIWVFLVLNCLAAGFLSLPALQCSRLYLSSVNIHVSLGSCLFVPCKIEYWTIFCILVLRWQGEYQYERCVFL